MTFYGDSTRWFLGRVIDINDPLRAGRVKVRIYGLHTNSTLNIPTEDLPWAQVANPTNQGGSSGLGNNLGILPQAQVYGFFLDGVNSQMPLVLGSISKIEMKFEAAPKPGKNTSSALKDVSNENISYQANPAWRTWPGNRINKEVYDDAIMRLKRQIETDKPLSIPEIGNIIAVLPKESTKGITSGQPLTNEEVKTIIKDAERLNEPDDDIWTSGMDTEIITEEVPEKNIPNETGVSEVDDKMPGVSLVEKGMNWMLSPRGFGPDADKKSTFNIMHASGIMGNLLQESGRNGDIRPWAEHKTELSIGVAQWNPAKGAGWRRQKMEAFAASLNLNPQTLYPQMLYLKEELLNPHPDVGDVGWSELLASNSIEEATAVFMNKFEKPHHTAAHLKNRIRYARETYNKFGGIST
tara:strand:- start:6825 stop:8054 length:1230 start_codon:yes stop_codon:yes gene_type:complete